MFTYMQMMQQVAGSVALVATNDAGMYCLAHVGVRGWKFHGVADGVEFAAFWHGEGSSTQMGCFTVEWEDADEEMHAVELWPHGAVVRLV